MADTAHAKTDKKLEEMEKRLSAIYSRAEKEIQKTIDDYFAKFAKRDAKQKARLEAGEITEQEYKQWRLAQMGRGERFKALQRRVAERYTEANETAVRYVNDATPGIYSLNRNYSAYTIEKVAGNVGFDLWDEQTVKRLIVDNPEVMPYYPPEKALKRGIDLAYGKKQISASVTSSILQGKSIPRIAKDLQTRMPEMNKSSAIRTARTAVTGAQNAGRMDSYVAAEKMGIKLKREWLAVIDNRTRHAHAMLDGQKAEMGKPFKVDGEEIMFPGDTSAPGYLVYNCRCSLGAVIDGVDDSTAKRRVKNPETGKYELVSDMTYSEWAGWKKKTAFTPAKTTEEAQQYAGRFVSTYKSSLTGQVDYGGIQLSYANEMNRAFTEVFDAYDTPYPLRNIKPFNTREKRFKGTTAEAAYQWGLNDMFYNKAYYKTAKAFNDHLAEYNKLLQTVLPNIDTAIAKTKPGTSLRYLEALKRTGRTNVFAPDAYGSTIHEMGHYLDDQIFRKAFKEKGFDLSASFEKYSGGISGYATATQQEYIAESFAAYWKGETDILDPDLIDIFKGLRKK